jgi:hypothetical protein
LRVYEVVPGDGRTMPFFWKSLSNGCIAFSDPAGTSVRELGPPVPAETFGRLDPYVR